MHQRRGTFRDETVDYAAVGATRAHDLMAYPPERSLPAEDAWRIGSGEARFATAAEQLMSWTALRGAGLRVEDVRPASGPMYTGVAFDEEGNAAVRECFAVGGVRSFDQDPRFGASVLTEIASRALSPATNDLGTAIDVIGRTVRLLSVWGEKPETEKEIRYPNVFVPPILIEDLFDDLFVPIARDGASTVEVGVRLQKAFRTLARFGHEGFAENAKRHSAEALERANAALVVEADKRRIEALARDVGAA